ncbi:MAG: efflux RND transporter periplasmic adaptor subunit [Pseudomonadota bacterium]|nr:efflux RND transporter periplasmic adaptor subunit [Pseudomonadota bacterium]
MNQNVRISLYIAVPIIFWMLSGFFVEDKKPQVIENTSLSSIEIKKSVASYFQPSIKLKANSISERRVEVRAKTTGEVVQIGARQGDFVEQDALLCSLGIVELNRTEVKAPFSGYIESIVKPGNFLDRGQICATIIDLDPIKFVAEVPEIQVSKVNIGQEAIIELITNQRVTGNLTFVSKSASPKTKTFKIESEIVNSTGSIKDGVTATMTIRTDPVLAHRISPSILVLDDLGRIGVKVVNSNNVVEFSEVQIIEDLEEGLWISGLPDSVEIIVQGQGFVEDGQIITDNLITNNG